MPGFLPFNATFMLDFVLVALVLVVPILIYGILQIHKKKYALHAKVMTFLTALIFVVVIIFEIDLRLSGGIEMIMKNAERSVAYTDNFRIVLNIHLFFAISTCVLWAATIYGAIRHYGLEDPRPSVEYSKKHKLLGRLSVIDMVAVAITGALVYLMAFIL